MGGRIGVLVGLWGSDRGFGGFWGVYGGRVGVFMGFHGGRVGVFDGFLQGISWPALNRGGVGG